MTQIKRRLVVVAPATKGVYDSEALYQRLAIVTNSARTKGYMSKINNNTGNPLSDSDAWMEFFNLLFLKVSCWRNTKNTTVN